MLETLFSTILAMSLFGSILWLMLLLARPLTGRVCTARWERGSRLLVLAAFLLPVGLCIKPMLKPSGVVTMPAALSPSGAASTLPPVWAIFSPADDRALFSLPAAAAMIWVCGVLSAALVLWIRQRRFMAKLRCTALPAESPRGFKALCRELGIRRIPALFSSDCIRSPLGAGLFRPALYLPEVKLEQKEWELILRHELIHLRRRDLWLKWGMLFCLALHWFNPLAWAFAREWGLLCEISCDEEVVGGLAQKERRLYGSTILNVLSRTAPQKDGVCATFCSGPAGLKRRLRHILRPRRSKAGQKACTLAAAAVMLAFLPLSSTLQVWAAPYDRWGDTADYQAHAARQALEYLPLGISYDAKTNRYFYEEEALSIFLDEYPPNTEELAELPQVQLIRRCGYFNADDPTGPGYRVLRDGERTILGLAQLSRQECGSYFMNRELSVCYNGYQTVRGGLVYAADPPWKQLPQNVRTWASSISPGDTAAMADGDGGYICFGASACPWRLDLTEETLRVFFYPSQTTGTELPGVVHYTANTALADLQIYVDDVLVRTIPAAQ